MKEKISASGQYELCLYDDASYGLYYISDIENNLAGNSGFLPILIDMLMKTFTKRLTDEPMWMPRIAHA